MLQGFNIAFFALYRWLSKFNLTSLCEPTPQVVGCPGVFCAGDAADVDCEKTAYTADLMGTVVALNIATLLCESKGSVGSPPRLHKFPEVRVVGARLHTHRCLICLHLNPVAFNAELLCIIMKRVLLCSYKVAAPHTYTLENKTYFPS